MKYLPILDELFSSNSIFILLLSLAITLILSMKLKDARKYLIGIVASFVVYAVCEALSNIRINNLIEITVLFAGTIAMGSFAGFLIGLVISKIRKQQIAHGNQIPRCKSRGI